MEGWGGGEQEALQTNTVCGWSFGEGGGGGGEGCCSPLTDQISGGGPLARTASNAALRNAVDTLVTASSFLVAAANTGLMRRKWKKKKKKTSSDVGEGEPPGRRGWPRFGRWCSSAIPSSLGGRDLETAAVKGSKTMKHFFFSLPSPSEEALPGSSGVTSCESCSGREEEGEACSLAAVR